MRRLPLALLMMVPPVNCQQVQTDGGGITDLAVGGASDLATPSCTDDLYTQFVADSGCSACSTSVQSDGLVTYIGGAGDAVDTSYGLRDFGGSSGLSGTIYTRELFRLGWNQTIAGNLSIFRVHDVNDQLIFEIFLAPDLTINLFAGGLGASAFSASTGVLASNDGSTFRRIEVKADRSAQTVEVRVDGTTVFTKSGFGASTTGPARYLLAGIHHYDGTSTAPVRTVQDHVNVGTTDWLGVPTGCSALNSGNSDLSAAPVDMAMVPNDAATASDMATESCISPTGSWSVANQPPTGCTPYAGGLFQKELPNAGSGGPVNHLVSNSSAIVSTAITGAGATSESQWGFTGIATPGSDDVIGIPMFYGRASDPIYKITSCGSGGSYVNTYWHIPSGARFSDIYGSDAFLTVWDQTTNKILSAYDWAPTFANGVLPACSATTQATACPMPSIGYCSMADYSSTTPYQLPYGGGDSLHSAPQAMVIRNGEWMGPSGAGGEIRHALYLNTTCEASSVVFPGLESAGRCVDEGVDPTNRPPHGSLFFLDYTDAQIDAMNLPGWQKPLIRAMAHYGGYIGDTNGHQNPPESVNISRWESGEAYRQANITDPLYNWLQNVQNMKCIGPSSSTGSQCRYEFSTWSNLPAVTGPSCPTQACGILGHFHVADPCVPLGMAGLPGGC